MSISETCLRKNGQDAQATLASHKLGFEKWCKQEFGWDARHVRRIIDAREMIGLIGPMGPIETLPTSEQQCRELSVVPKDKVADNELADPLVYRSLAKHW